MTQPAGRAVRGTGSSRKPREERWSELLETATDIFFEKGYDAASLQDIADRLGLLKGSLYYYIKSKEDLLFEVIKDVFEKGLENVEALAAEPGDPIVRFHGVVVGHVEYMCRRPKASAVFLHEMDKLSRDRQQAMLGGDHAYRSVYVGLIKEGQAAGLIRPELDPRLTSLSILGSLNWVYRWFRPGHEFSPQQIGRNFADINIRGIATEKGLESLPPLKAKRTRQAARAVGKAG